MVSSLTWLALVPCLAAAPAEPEPERLDVYPQRIQLAARRSQARIVVTGIYPGGETRDLTRAAVFTSSAPRIVTVQDGVAQPGAEGKGEITVAVAGRRASIPVEVTGQQDPDPIRFRTETLAILTRHGCNSGSCHGSPQGKGGFSLSLFGYDPLIDAESLVRGGLNRRTDSFNPAQSLLLKKPLMRLPHIGGKRLTTRDPGYQILLQWIREGCRTNDEGQARCVRLVIHPGPSRVLRAPHLRQQLAVRAEFADGTVRDVTGLATFEVSHKEILSVSETGLVTGIKRGQGAVSVRYLDHLESVHFTVTQDVEGFAWNNPAENNLVDARVHAKLRQLQVLPSDTCDDATFLRRVSLDLTGLLPPAQRVKVFLADPAADKRSRVIEELLGSEEFARYFASRLADLLRVNPQALPEGRAEVLANFLIAGYRTNQRYDQMATQILTATGDAGQVPGSNYFLAASDLNDMTETTAQLFMGSRINCAKCHNHPFENWTQEDYYRISAVFARVEKTGKGVALKRAGEVRHPTSGKTLVPFGDPPTDDKADRRAAFAAWLTRPGNPYFARVEVNRLWAQLFGRGIVEPVDDFRSSNPPSNPELLDALAEDFERSGYDRKHILRLICNSRTYQRSTAVNRFNEADSELFSHFPVRRLTAEQIQDAIGYATGSLRSAAEVPAAIAALEAEVKARPEDKTQQQALRRLRQRQDYATQRLTPEQSPFLKAFGQPRRDTPCACERIDEPTVDQALQLLNGPLVSSLVDRGAARYVQIPDDGELVERLWLASLGRLPTAAEKQQGFDYLEKKGARIDAVRDLVWAVVNTREFLLQH